MAYADGMSVLNPIPPASVVQKLREYGYTGGRLLDVGCGRGTTLRCIAEQYPDASLDGIDPEPEIESTERIRITTGNMESLPYPDEEFDAVLTECSFSLASDANKAASSLFRVLRSGGILLLTDLYGGERASASLSDGGLVRNLYAENDLCAFLKSAGFLRLAFIDYSRELTDMAIRMVLDGSVCACMNINAWNELKAMKPHYGMWLFEKGKE